MTTAAALTATSGLGTNVATIFAEDSTQPTVTTESTSTKTQSEIIIQGFINIIDYSNLSQSIFYKNLSFDHLTRLYPFG